MQNLPSPKPGHPRTPQSVYLNYQPKSIQLWIMARPEPMNVSHNGQWSAQNRRTYRILADEALGIDDDIAFLADEAPKNDECATLCGHSMADPRHSLDPYNTKQHIPQSATARERKRTQTNGNERKRTETNGNERKCTRPVASSSAERLAQNVSRNPSSTRDVRELT